jgi:hypothetical protein
MTEHWQVEGPRVIDVGGEQQRVTKVIVAIVGGHVDVLGHAPETGTATPEDGDTIPGGPHGARVQVTSVQGLPLRVSWDGSTLRVMHVKETDETVLDALKRLIGARGVPTAVVTVSVPAQCRANVNTVSASVLASGLHRGLTVNTVSGEATVSEVGPTLTLHTVSGAAECAAVDGEASIATVSGDVLLHSSALTRAAVNTVSGTVGLDLTQGQVTVRSSSVSGDVTVRAPFTGYAVGASTMSGQVVVDGTALTRPSEGNTRSARAGDESLVVKANSVSGNIVVLRSQPQDASPHQASPQPAPQDAPESPPAPGSPAAPPPSEPGPWPTGSPWADQVDDPEGFPS